jgi:hypothetical protein
MTDRLTAPVHRSIVVVDIERSTRRPDRVSAELRHRMYRLTQEAMTFAGGAEPCRRDPFTDRGDGLLMLIRPADDDQELARLVAGCNLPAEAVGQCSRIRLRAAVHAGEIHYDREGFRPGARCDLPARGLSRFQEAPAGDAGGTSGRGGLGRHPHGRRKMDVVSVARCLSPRPWARSSRRPGRQNCPLHRSVLSLLCRRAPAEFRKNTACTPRGLGDGTAVSLFHALSL